MSANPNLKECRIDKTQDALVEFVAETKKAFEVNQNDLNQIPIDQTVDWAKNLMKSSQDVKSPDASRQTLLDDLRGFVREVRKAFTKHEDDLNDIPVDSVINQAQALLQRAGYEDPVAPAPRRAMGM